MRQKLSDQINNISLSIKWIKKYKPEDYNRKFLLLVEERRRLRKLERASKEKPAIAAFGESQKGKSYLMGNLLQNNGSPFKIKINDKNEEVNFVQNINPIGDKKEATGVVTRFTTFSEEDNRYSNMYPVIIKLLTPASIATILCDSYHKDIMDYQTYSDAEIKKFSEDIYETYKDRPEIEQSALVEDDVLEIKYYLSKFLAAETQNIRRSNYFQILAMIIRRVPVTDWYSVLKYLWHENAIISNMFIRMINVLEKFHFASEIYTDIETVRHYGDNMNTIMSVDCLNGLDNKNWDRVATVCLKNSKGEFVELNGIPKCELAAVCAETIYKVESVYVTDEVKYKIYDGNKVGDLPLESQQKLSHKSVTKDLLNCSDLLDFPGARNRLRVKEIFLDKVDQTTGTSNAVQMLLRGKVAYLFNSYSESRMVNILLFCHDAEAIVVNDMYIMVNDWVEKYVGNSADTRKAMIEKCGGIPPLFNICTKFNIDMIEDDNEEKNNDAALNQRWSGRLLKVLYTQAFKANDVDWFRNWDGVGRTFTNSYLLRDFKYSGCTGSGNNLYDGYKETDEHPAETVMKLSLDFYNRMRNTFIHNSNVEMFFEDPALAWDVAATRNNDGSLFIIDKLCIVARNAASARDSLFKEEMLSVRNAINSLMKEYYVSTNLDEILENNIRKAKSIFREMDFTCNSDNYYFGHLLNALQISETESYRVVHSIMQSPEINGKVNDFKDYEIIRNSCKKAGYPLENAKTNEEKWPCIIKTYGFDSLEDAENFLKKKKIDVFKLFDGTYKRKLNSYIFGDAVYEKWMSLINSSEFMNEFSGEGNFDSNIMSTLVDDIIDTANSLNVRDRMAESIAEYVNVVNIHTANEDLLADILASLINDYVLDFGFKYLSEEAIEKTKKICENKNIPTFNYITQDKPTIIDEEDLTAMFNEMSNNPMALLPSFEDNYNKWIEYMFVSFIANLDVPDYNHEANEELAQILAKIKSL